MNSDSNETATETRVNTIMRHINDLYEHLDDIRRNANVINSRIPNLTQTSQLSQIARINSTYENMYCHTLNHIESLFETIREENYRTRSPPSVGNYAFVNGSYYHLTQDSVFNLLQYANSREQQTEGRDTPSSPISSNSNRQQSTQGLSGTSNVEEINTPSRPNPSPRRPERRRTGAGGVRRNIQHQSRVGLGNRQWGTTHSRYNSPWNRQNIYPHNTPNWRSSLVNQSPLGIRQQFSNNFTNIFDTIVSDMIPNFTNVPVFPSPQQISQATRTITYGEIENPVSTQCPISLEPFRDTDSIVQIRQCGHIFHRQSLNEWFQQNVRCPMCRYDIRDYINPDENNIVEEPIFSASLNTNFPSFDVSNNTTNPNVSDATEPIIDPSTNNVNTPQNITEPQDVLRESIFNLISTATGIPNLSELNIPTDSSGNTQSDESMPRQNTPPQPTRQPVNPIGEMNPDDILRNAMTNHMNILSNPNTGQQILQNLFTNNVNNLTFDQSNNTLNFETFITGTETSPFGFMQFPRQPPTDSSNNNMDVD